MGKEIKKRGGIFKKRYHSEGGEHFIVPESGQHVEIEKDEALIPAEAMKDKKVKKRTGTNVEILDQINKKVGAKGMTEEVEEVHSGDAVVCRKSMYDKKKRTYIGTDRQITSAINVSNGCKVIEKGAKAVEPNGKVVQYKTGGKLKKFKKIDFSKLKKLTKKEKEEIRQKRWVKKRERIQELANNIQRLRLNVTRDLKSDNEKTFLTALVVAVMDRTGERVGNEESASNGHYGITGFRKKHIKINGNKITFGYVGKSGVEHDTSFSDADIAKYMKKAIENSKGYFVFTTSEGFRIKADRVNRYLDDFNISAKDIRGYTANKLILEKLRNVEIEEKDTKRKRQLNKIVTNVAIKIGHGRATLKNHYMIPELEYEYVQNGKIIDIKDLGYFSKGGELKSKSKTLKKAMRDIQKEVPKKKRKLKKPNIKAEGKKKTLKKFKPKSK